MPASELVLRFGVPDRVNVSYAGTDSGAVPFVSPVTDKDRNQVRSGSKYGNDAPGGAFSLRGSSRDRAASPRSP